MPLDSRCARIAFDRGTVVVDGDRPAIEALEGCGLLWDGRVGVFRAPADRYRDLAREAERAGIELADEVARRGLGHPTFSCPRLRPFQSDALVAWEMADRRGVVAIPTGGGKTFVAFGATAAVGGPTIILVPTRVLLEQWSRRLREHMGVEPAVHGDGEHGVGPVTVCTFESAFRHMDEFGDRFDLVVVDEVHHFGGGARTEALQMCTAPARLGLTATPPTSPDAVSCLRSLVGPIVFESSVADLAGRFLAPFQHHLTRVDLTAGEREEYACAFGTFTAALRVFQRSNPGGSWADFARVAVRTPAGREALAGYRTARRIAGNARGKLAVARELLLRYRGARTLVFTADNAAVYDLSRELLVPPITCDIGRKEREAVLARFREGAVMAIVSAQVLNEGIDVPEAGVGLILGGSLGSREHVQRVGRLLRPMPGKTAVVHEVVATATFEEGFSWSRRKALVR